MEIKFIDHTIKCCAVPSDDLTAVVLSEGGTAQRLIVASIIDDKAAKIIP